jgi:hypothetical protein
MRACKRLLNAPAAVFAVAAVTFSVCLPASAAEPGSTTTAAVHSEGIWKAVVPPTPMKSEFDGFDPIGIAAGARIKADCSLNWINPDDGARYCFSSGTSLEFFLESPHANIASARAAWRKLNGEPGT